MMTWVSPLNHPNHPPFMSCWFLLQLNQRSSKTVKLDEIWSSKSWIPSELFLYSKLIKQGKLGKLW